MLADAGVESAPTGSLPGLVGRAVQLGYPQPAATALATTVLAFVAEHGLAALPWADLRTALLPAPSIDDSGGMDADDEDDSDDWDDEPDAEVPAEASVASGPARSQLLASPLLLSSLEQAAAASNPQAHYLLASLLRCGRPNPYLYEESLKGRVLTAIERGWVEDYLRLEPQYRKYGTAISQPGQIGVDRCDGVGLVACRRDRARSRHRSRDRSEAGS